MVKYKERRLLMRNPILLFISLLSFLFCCSAQSSYWQQEIKYDIDVDFNHQIHQFNLSEEITYTNNSPDDLNKVFFHLYYNAFQPGSMMDVRSRTIADPDSRVGNRIYHLKKNEIGYQKIISVKEDGKNDLKFNVQGTILEVLLNKPLRSGKKLNLIYFVIVKSQFKLEELEDIIKKTLLIQ